MATSTVNNKVVYSLQDTSTSSTTYQEYSSFRAAPASTSSAYYVSKYITGYLNTAQSCTGRIYGHITEISTGSSGSTLSYGICYGARNSRNYAGTVTNAYGFHYEDGASTGTITNSYAFFASSVTGGASSNYAIYTNAGVVRLGDYITQTLASTSASGAVYSNYFYTYPSPTGSSNASYYGSYFANAVATAQTFSGTGAAATFAIKTGTTGSTLATGIANLIQIDRAGAGTITNAYGSYIIQQNSTGTLTNEYGIYIGNITYGAASNYAIYTNTGAIRFGDSVTCAAGVVVQGRLCMSNFVTFNANDTSPTVAAANYFKVPNTWTAGNNITTFDDGFNGQKITIIGGDSDCVVVDGSTLKLNGNWTAASDATLTLIYDGSNWYEIGRSAN